MLRDIYKKVLVCKGCKKEYGIDSKSDNGFCPYCCFYLRGKRTKSGLQVFRWSYKDLENS